MAAPQVDQDRQSLPTDRQTPPPRSALRPPGCQQLRQVAKGRAGQIQPRWVDKHNEVPGLTG
ncbi:hypothetical protein GCM10010420_53190 [Streptomyces glaucosporus]|uniref:Uncharacterized protein n=1 Tax=Streptomyces glaucosporus TaxID=284044 RepID=A0ABN3IYN7_9ACTN